MHWRKIKHLQYCTFIVCSLKFFKRINFWDPLWSNLHATTLKAWCEASIRPTASLHQCCIIHFAVKLFPWCNHLNWICVQQKNIHLLLLFLSNLCIQFDAYVGYIQHMHHTELTATASAMQRSIGNECTLVYQNAMKLSVWSRRNGNWITFPWYSDHGYSDQGTEG